MATPRRVRGPVRRSRFEQQEKSEQKPSCPYCRQEVGGGLQTCRIARVTESARARRYYWGIQVSRYSRFPILVVPISREWVLKMSDLEEMDVAKVVSKDEEALRELVVYATGGLPMSTKLPPSCIYKAVLDRCGMHLVGH